MGRKFHYQNKNSLFFLFIFLTLIILPDWIEIYAEHIPIKKAIGELLRAYLVLMIPLLFIGRWYKKYLLFLVILGAFLTPFDLGFLYLYHTRIDQVAFDIAMQTNIQEALEYTDGYRLYFLGGMFVYFGFLVILYKKINFENIKILKWSGFISLLIILLMTYRSSTIVNNTNIVTAKVFIKTLFNNIITTNAPWMAFKYAYIHTKKKFELEAYQKLKANFHFNAKKEDNISQIHVLVIGESSRYDHWQINGYTRKTDPYLIQEKSLISLSSVITGAGATNWSVPMLISPSDASNFDDTLKELSLIGAFKEAGYKTFWLSNQDWFPYLNIHIDEADYQFFLKRKDRFAYDEGLLPQFDEILNSCKNDNCLIVLHIMGNHWRYDKRNPPKFDIFKPAIDRNAFIRMDDYQQQKEIINSYDNTIVYNDYFLHKVIERLKKMDIPATMTFVADHGENLYDTKKHLFGHGRRINPYVCQVPYFFWYSKQYQKLYSIKISHFLINKDKKISSATNLFYTMLDLGQIYYPDINLSKSLLNNDYVESKRIVLQGLNPIDYDQYMQKAKQ